MTFVESQRRAFQRMAWHAGDLLPYAERRDGTLGQYLANYHLIRLEPFMAALGGKTAVTVCDGRGVEATYLKHLGLTVTATDIVPQHLEKLHSAGLVDACSQENAECLSFPDESFDWGLVKAGLHHLPRPMLGLYELLRVCREGIIILEAQDSQPLRLARRMLFPMRDFEPSGNYVYRFTTREIVKAGASLGLPIVAFSTALMVWRRAHEEVHKGSVGYSSRRVFYRLLNLLVGRFGNLFAAVIFKRAPHEKRLRLLRECGFRLRTLPQNPYTE